MIGETRDLWEDSENRLLYGFKKLMMKIKELCVYRVLQDHLDIMELTACWGLWVHQESLLVVE